MSQVTARIMRLSTGEIREHDAGDSSEYGDALWFMWREGNYSCDCNRELFWLRSGENNDIDAARLDEREAESTGTCPAGERAFAVQVVVDGEVVYEDDEWPGHVEPALEIEYVILAPDGTRTAQSHVVRGIGAVANLVIGGPQRPSGRFR